MTGVTRPPDHDRHPGGAITHDRRWIEQEARRDAHGRPVAPQDRDLQIVRALWRGGFLTQRMIAAEWWPTSSLRHCSHRLKQLTEVGWIARYRPRTDTRSGSAQYVYYLTRDGFRLAQHAFGPGGAYIRPDARWQEINVVNHQSIVHDLRAHAWLLAYNHATGERLADWRGPRDGAITVPTRLTDGRREPVTLPDLQLPGTQRVDGLATETFAPLLPDATIELHDPNTGHELDVLIEFDRTGRPAKNAHKLLHSDALITAWWRLVPRWRAINQPPVVVFVSTDDRHMHSLMALADRLLTGRIARPANPVTAWPYPGRRRARFCLEHELLAGNTRAFRLPDRPSEAESSRLELRETHLPGAG